MPAQYALRYCAHYEEHLMPAQYALRAIAPYEEHLRRIAA